MCLEVKIDHYSTRTSTTPTHLKMNFYFLILSLFLTFFKLSNEIEVSTFCELFKSSTMASSPFSTPLKEPIAVIKTLDDEEYDFAENPSMTTARTGFTFEQRKKLDGDLYQKFHERAIKSNIEDKFSKASAVTSFDPNELAKANNFISTISTTRSKLNKMKSHFALQGIIDTFEVLGIFTEEAKMKVGMLSPCLLDDFTKFDIDQVHKSVEIHVIRSKKNAVIHSQNNSISYQYIMNSCDSDMQNHIEDCLSRYEEDYFRYSGVLAFHIMITAIYKHTHDTGLKLEVSLTELRLAMFPGEDVSKAVATIRAIKSFLTISESQYAKKVFKVLTGGSHLRLRSFLVTLDDMGDNRISSAEKMMSIAQEKYFSLVQDGDYLPNSKTPASFKQALGGKPNAHPLSINPNVQEKTATDGKTGAKDDQGRYIYNRKGRKIDYEPPKQGEPKVRTVNGREEKFCTKCKFPRWGLHGDEEHEEWVKTTRGFRFSNNRRSSGGDTPNESNAVAPSRVAAFVPDGNSNYFCTEAATGLDF